MEQMIESQIKYYETSDFFRFVKQFLHSRDMIPLVDLKDKVKLGKTQYADH